MKQILQALLDAARTTDTTDERIAAVRAALAEHPDADLTALESAAMAAFDELRKQNDAPTADDLAAMEAIADTTDAIRTAQSEAAQAAAEQAARLDALASRMAPPPAASEGGTTEEDTESPETGGTDGADNTGSDPTPATTTEAREPALVASNTPARRTAPATPARVPLGNLPTQLPTSTLQAATTFAFTAAADVPGYSAGATLNGLAGLADAATARMQALSRGARGRTSSVGVATIRRNTPDSRLIADERDWRKLDLATKENLLPGGSLVAAAGWCAPSETEYGIQCQVASMDGMVDIPRLTLIRGGVRWPTVPDFSVIWGAEPGFEFTEQEIIDGVEKPCYEIPCDVDWNECRLDVIGLCVTANLLMERGYPELVEYFLEQLLAVHAHRVNRAILERMVALATPRVIPGTGGNPFGLGATVTLLGLLELQVEWYRYHYRMPHSATLEGVAPYWLRPVLRSDLAKRTGVDTLAVSDAQLDAYMLSRGVRMQFVYDWQDAYATGNPADMGGSTPAQPGPPPVPASVGHETWPATVQILLYPAGTYFAGQADVVTINGLYDSTLLRQNQRTLLFTEEGLCVSARGCNTPMLLEMPICPNGVTAAPAEPACPAA